MKEMKRVISLVLCFVMLVGLLPTFAIEAKAADTPVDALVVFTDLHAMYNGDSSTGDKGYKQSKITDMMNALKNTGLPFSSVHSGGDAFSSNSTQNTNYTDTVTGYIQNVLGDIPVGYVWSDHDRGALDNATNKNKLDKTSHLSYGAGADGEYGTADDENYYVYYLSMGDLCSYDRYGAGFNYTQTDNSGRVSAGFTPTVAEAIANFQADAAKLDKSKPLFIISHQPLFDNRNDNAWAEDWFDAINAVAAEMDVAFFYGHNHKYDSGSDYYYAKGSSMPVATADNWGWKYETKAGYMGYLPSMDLSSESKTLNFTHMCGGYFDPDTTGSTSGTTREGTMVAVEIYDDRIQYTTYDDAGVYTGDYALNESVTRDHAKADEPEGTTPNKVYCTAELGDSGYYMEATAPGLTAITADYVYEAYETLILETFSDGLAFDVTLEGHNADDDVAYYFEKDYDIDAEGLVLYHVGENNELTAIPYELVTEDGLTYISFTSKLEGVFIYGTVAIPEDYALSELTVDYRGATKYLVGETLDMVNMTVTAVYTKEGAEDLGKDLYPVSETVSDGYTYTIPDMTTPGVKTITLTYGEESASFQVEVFGKNFVHEQTDITVEVTVPGVTGVEAAPVTEGVAFNAAATVLASGFVAYDIDLPGFVNNSGTATVTLPLPEGVEEPLVYYISDDGATREEMTVTGVADGYVTFETDHFSTYAVGRAIVSGEWVEITAPEAGTEAIYNYKYVLETDGISTDTKYLIVNTSSNGTAYVVTNDGDGSVSRTPVTISNGAITVEDETDIAWTFSGTSSGSVGNQGRYLYPNNGSLATNNSSSSSQMTFGEGTNGAYRLYRTDNQSRKIYVRYNQGWTGTRVNSYSSTTYSVYLFAYDSKVEIQAAVPGADGLYGKLVGENVFNVPRHTSPEAALAIVKAGVEVRYFEGVSPDASVAGEPYGDEDSGMDWIMDPNYNGGVAGSYTVTVKYNDTVLGTVTVVVPEFEFKPENANLSDTVGSVSKGAASDAEVGVTLTIIDNDGVEHNVNVTLDMLTDADGNPVSTAEKTTYEKLTLTYNGVKITDEFTLNVVGRAGNNYPEHPEEGAVKVNKTATGVDFQESGLAQIEVSTSGVPMSVGVDVIVMLDLSSSMERCIAHDDKNCTVSDCVTRLEALQSALATFQSILQSSPNKDIIKVAIADFNVFYTTGPVAYDSSDYIEANFGASGTNHIFTGDGTISAGAFEPAAELDVSSYSLNYGSGTNYDYAFDTIYQLGSAIRAYNEQNNQSERELVVLFMSDGAANQFNFYRSSGADKSGYTDDDPDYKWNFWLDGTWTADDLTSSNLNSTTHSYYYDLNDHDGDGHLNEHRMANAIKGDPDTKYEVIRKSASVAGGVTLEAGSNTNLYMAPGLGATLYSVAFDIANDGPITDEAAFAALEQIASSDEQYVNAASQTELENAFRQFASDILYAANNARFVDQMGANYNVPMEKQTYTVVVDGEEVTKTVYPVIEVIEYDIWTRAEYEAGSCTQDMIGSRKGTSTLKEVVKFSDDGTKAYSSVIDVDKDGTFGVTVNADGTYTISDADDNIIGTNGVIYAKSFYYNTNKGVNGGVALEGVKIPTDVDSSGLTVGETNVLPAETFYWNLGQVKTTELAMRYYVYLDGSMEGTKEAGSYATNNFAILYYDNYLENPCYKPTVSPTMAWKEATVSYAFYLVDKDGNTIINQTTGAIGGFADRIAITNPVVYDTVLLNNDEGETLDIIFARDVLPNYYVPYDDDASYHVVVESNGTGSWTITKGESATTTYVMNYDKNNAAAFSGALAESTVGYDYTHTVVWFAVELIPQAHPDTVVIDYGLPVDISVLANDMFGTAGAVTGVGPVNEEKLDKLQAVERDANVAESYTSTYGTAQINTATGKIRYTPSSMEMKGYDRFMYEVNYTGIKNADGEIQSPAELLGYYYDTVTVIPATTIYYEDNFVNTSSFTWKDNAWTEVTDKNSENWTWEQIGKVNGVQDEDRPGEYSLTDANNIYGYDKANLNMSTYSMGNALKATVDYDNYAQANFKFWGTGFDVISMTNSDTGTILVDVYALDDNGVRGDQVKSLAVDTYYGYKKADCHVIYTYKDTDPKVNSNTAGGDTDPTNDYEWVITDVVHESKNCTAECVTQTALPETAEVLNEVGMVTNYWIVDNAASDTIWQVPVMEVENLTYGYYEVEIRAVYSPGLDHKAGSVEGEYEFHLDAVRIYDPANDGAADGADDDTIEDAYIQDGEGWPSYFELRNALLDADALGNTDTATAIEGLVFIDGDESVGQAEIADYMSFGPNNEVYLAPGQRVAFLLSDVLNADGKSIVDQIHIGIKSADGQTGTYTITNVAASNKDKVAAGDYYGEKTYRISTSTDMYYDLTSWKGDIIVISNTGNRSENNTTGIISITNIKATYTQDPETAKVYIPMDPNTGIATASVEDELEAPAVYAYMTPQAATLTLRALNAPAVQEPETEPTEPEVPETTVPEETEPEETVPEVTEPDNTELKAAVEAAKKLKEKDYTKESFKAVKDARKAAEKVLKDKKATQDQIDAALEELNEAVESLEVKPSKDNKPAKGEKPAKNDKVEEVRNNVKETAKKVVEAIVDLLTNLFR